MKEARTAFLKRQICSWWSSRSWWPCRRETGSRWSSSWEGPGAPCKLSCWRRQDEKDLSLTDAETRGRRAADVRAASPYVCHGFPVLVVRSPHGYFVPFRADVDHGAADVVAVVVEGFAH